MYTPEGRASIRLARNLVDHQAHIDDRDERRDVIHELGVELLRFRGRYELFGGASIAYNQHRNLDDDAVNLNARFGTSIAW